MKLLFLRLTSCLLLKQTQIRHQDVRLHSLWYNNTRKPGLPNTTKFDGKALEQLFIDDQVQRLLRALTGLDVEKLHQWRMTSASTRRHYALMTDGMFNEFKSRLSRRARYFLQLTPFKEPRANRFETVAMNAEISGHDTYNLVFTDISHDATNQDRTIVIREPNGRLRTALPEEHYRMQRVYYDQPDRPVNEPPLFALQNLNGKSVPGEALEDALGRGEHVFVLDWACHLYEPDHPKFVELCKCIFDRTIEAGKLDLLHSTRHFGTLLFYMLINGQLQQLFAFFAQTQSISGAANTIRLYRTIYPDWKTTISSHDSDVKVIEDFCVAFESSSQGPQQPVEEGARGRRRADMGPRQPELGPMAAPKNMAAVEMLKPLRDLLARNKKKGGGVTITG